MNLPFFSTATQDSTGASTAYDSLWANADVPTAAPTPLESIMLAQDKLYVVLAVVLVIWFGVLFILFRTDRRLAALEREVEERIPETPPHTPAP